jgi:hypothetical protein
MLSAIEKLIGASAIYVATTNIIAVISIGPDGISLAATEISAVLSLSDNGAFGDEIIKILNLVDSMEPSYVNVNSFSAKYRSKREIYTFLTVDGEVYLPPFETVTVYFLKDIVEGNKKCTYSDLFLTILVVSTHAVRHLSAPQYDNLSMGKILDFLAQFEAMHLFMPAEPHEIKKLPRAWVINVGATVVGQPFVEWVSKRITARNKEMAQDRNLLIKMDPQLAAAFQRSTAISTSNGNAAHMLKAQVSN